MTIGPVIFCEIIFFKKIYILHNAKKCPEEFALAGRNPFAGDWQRSASCECANCPSRAVSRRQARAQETHSGTSPKGGSCKTVFFFHDIE